MTFLEIIAIIFFFLSLSSWGLIIEQEKTFFADRMGMFRSEFFCNIVYIFSVLFVISSGIVLIIYSWKITIIIFIAAGISYPILGKPIIRRFWGMIYYFFDSYARRKSKKQNEDS